MIYNKLSQYLRGRGGGAVISKENVELHIKVLGVTSNTFDLKIRKSIKCHSYYLGNIKNFGCLLCITNFKHEKIVSGQLSWYLRKNYFFIRCYPLRIELTRLHGITIRHTSWTLNVTLIYIFVPFSFLFTLLSLWPQFNFIKKYIKPTL